MSGTRVIEGRKFYLDPEGSVIGVSSTHSTAHRLTEEERMEIVNRLDAGETANGIALIVGVSSRTVHRMRDALGMRVPRDGDTSS
jgi:FixJ family two-component response regulator